MTSAYPDTKLFIAGQWEAGTGTALPVLNPATGQTIGQVAVADEAALARAAQAAASAFADWSQRSAYERARLLRLAAQHLREDAEDAARLMTLEQGKPLAESRAELAAAADTLAFFAEEGRRAYGRVIPPRAANIRQMALREPVGVVAAFTPWNFPVNQAMRKLAAALAAGCTVILKGPEETPASCAAMIAAFAKAGLPAGAVNLVFGNPAQISSYLIAHPAVRKISFTGSTPVGKHLAALAGQHMKRATMELGGHAPAIIAADADLDQAASVLAAAKFRNAGQVCISPTRLLVQREVFTPFLERLTAKAEALTVGDGLDAATTMGPMANARRVEAMEALIGDATAQGARLVTGGKRLDNEGFFFAPTILAEVPVSAKAMNEEPFGPLALVNSFERLEEALTEANRLPFGLASYGFARSEANVARIAAGIQAGMVSINHAGLGLPENPFGGVKESGYGSEGGPEALEAYLVSKFVTVAA